MSAVWKLILGARSAALGVSLVFVCSAVPSIWSGNALRYEDETEYQEVAQSLVHNQGFVTSSGRMTVLRPPGYPMILAAVYEIVDTPLAAKILNCVLLAAASYLLILVSRRLFPSDLAISPYLVLFYPPFLYAATTLYPQTVGGLLLLAAILVISGDRYRWVDFVWAGIIYGFLCLAIPSFLYITPILLAFLVFRRGRPTTNSFISAATLAIFVMLTIAPWTIRNAIDFHAFVPISANGGRNLAIGNSAVTKPNGKADLHDACPHVPFIPNEVAFDKALAQCAVAWMTNNPSAALRLYFGKLLNYFNFRNDLTTSTEHRWWQDWVVVATYYPLLLVALFRLGMVRRYRITGLEALLYALYFVNGVLSAVFFTRLRFRLPFDLLLVAIDAAFLGRLLMNDPERQAASVSSPRSSIAPNDRRAGAG